MDPHKPLWNRVWCFDGSLMSYAVSSNHNTSAFVYIMKCSGLWTALTPIKQTPRSVPPAESSIDLVRMEEPTLKMSLGNGGPALAFISGALTCVLSHCGQ
jgi:hypothetical protein